ncbi:unnamed protein product [Rodentolepis nana]|uniref:SSXT domain-containing protein n=1 Tax=Rodentolepis nana TaxID=102285 RepID=A0A0R3TDD0_RODNA|nr:unnamed protein product [Rodentolepis nana]
MSWIIATDENPSQFTVDRIMDENDFLLDIINKKLNSGDFEEAVSFQKILQRNLIFLMQLKSQSRQRILRGPYFWECKKL